MASVMMFAAIAFLWTFVGALGSRFAEKRAIKRGETQNPTSDSDSDNSNSVIDDTKTMVKKADRPNWFWKKKRILKP